MSLKIKDDDSNYKELIKELQYFKNHALKIGVLSDDEVDGVSVKEYSIYVEFGTDHIPARPFFRTATQSEEATKNITDYMKDEYQKVINLKKTAKQAMDATGMYIQGLIQKSIKEGDWEPNAPATIEMKGKNNPLIDTSTLIKSISYEIVNRSEVKT